MPPQKTGAARHNDVICVLNAHNSRKPSRMALAVPQSQYNTDSCGNCNYFVMDPARDVLVWSMQW